MELFHRVLGTHPLDGPMVPLVILHGLLGSSDNWQTLGLRWAEDRPVILIDQRNHGRSPHHPNHSYPDMVIDLLDTLDALGVVQADLLGHSMGGKTAMYFADRYPERCRSLIIADMAPVAYPPHHLPLFDALASLDLDAFERRGEIDVALAADVPEAGVRQFLLKGLYRDDAKRFAWRFNLPVLRRHLADMTGHRPLGVVGIPALCLYGTRSDYVVGRGMDAMKRHFVQLETQALDAGHWLHAEQPQAFDAAVRGHLHQQGS
ncbi:MAG: alpha/beta fold hydrolase [Flavobacteriales bacterium]|jgi:pimeloyl-ACP methyl ester carboxylesterase|nr:alpha/beta fold hydrolase [Flavobacteriales bacterium]